MKRLWQRVSVSVRLAGPSWLAVMTAALLPVAYIFYVQGRALVDRGTTAVSWVEAASFDLPFRLRRTIRKEDVLIVQITTNGFDRLDANRDSRVDRGPMAAALRRLADREPRLLLLDCLFSDATGDAADRALAEQLLRLTNVLVLATSVQGASEQPAGLFASGAVAVGSVDVDRQPWNTVRLLPGRFSRESNGLSVAWVAAGKLGLERAGLGGGMGLRWLNYYGRSPVPNAKGDEGAGPFPTVDFIDLVESNGTERLPELAERRHQLVFLGDSRRDLFRNPVDGVNMPGVMIHATAVANLREGALRLVPPMGQIAFFLVWGTVLVLYLDANRNSLARGFVVAATLLLFIASVVAQLYGRVWWWWLIPVAFQAPVALALSMSPGGRVFFISYRHSDGRDEAQWLEGAIRGAGRRVFLAPGNIEAGEELWPELRRRIDRAPVFLLVLTPHARSELLEVPEEALPPARIPWVRREVEHALRRRRRILVLRVGTPPLKPEELRAEVRGLAGFLSMEYAIHNRDDVVQAAFRALHVGTPATP